MVSANLSHIERLYHDALFYSLSKVTRKWLIYHQKREKSEKCLIILLERERERESPIQVGICYNEWVFAMVATTHWVLATVANTQLWVFATMSGYLLR